MSKEKNMAFFKGAAVLSISVIVTKILGVGFKVPLSYVLGDEGMGYFNTAYAIYGFFYILCTAGVPKAVTLILSGHGAGDLEKINEEQVLKSALKLFTKIGLFSTIINIICAPALAEFVGNPNALISMLAIAPSLFFVSLNGVLRGYLNRFERLMPIAISQLIEGGVKLIIGLGLALVGIRLSAPVKLISALAILGISIGSIVSYIYMRIMVFYQNNGHNYKQKYDVDKKHINSLIIKNALPIAICSSLLNLSSTIDLTIIIKRLVNSGLDEIQANSLYGNYTTLAIPMFTLVISVLSPIATSYMPRLSVMHIKGDRSGFLSELNRLILITILISAPASLTFYFYSFDLLDILFSVQSSVIGAEMLACLSAGICALASLTVINTALEAQGKIAATVISLISGALVKLIVSYVLVGINGFGILGAPIGTVVSYITSLFISLIALHISGVKSRIVRKILGVYAVGIVCFYIPCRLIYRVAIVGTSFISMAISLVLSFVLYACILCIVYMAFRLKKYTTCTNKRRFGYTNGRNL